MLENFDVLTYSLVMSHAQGFRYFTLYLRGREELLVTVSNQPSPSPTPPSGGSSPAYAAVGAWMSASPTAAAAAKMEAPREQASNPNGPPPASPAVNEIAQVSEGSATVYLVGGYAKYKQPYVWLRAQGSNPSPSKSKDAKDMPLKLESTDAWKKDPKAVRVWHVVAELVRATVHPAPENPLAVDHSFFDTLPSNEQAVASGALAGFLREVYTSTTDKYTAASALVLADMQACLDRHFVLMKGLTEEAP